MIELWKILHLIIKFWQERVEENNTINPSKVCVISGTVTGKDAGGVLKVNAGGQIYNVLITYENGRVVCENLLDEALNYGNTRELLYSTDSFNAENVNKTLEEKWSSKAK